MDPRRRQLERDLSLGDLQAEVEWLRDRQRAGELSNKRLRLAAYVGHPAAVRAIGEVQVEWTWAFAGEPDLLTWVGGLSTWGEEPARLQQVEGLAWGEFSLPRAAIALARLGLPDSSSKLSRNALVVAERFVVAPTPVVAQVAQESAAACICEPTFASCLAGITAAHCSRPGSVIQLILAVRTLTECSLKDAKAGLSAPGWCTGMLARAVAERVGEDRVRTAIREALAPWALGFADPVRERVLE